MAFIEERDMSRWSPALQGLREWIEQNILPRYGLNWKISTALAAAHKKTASNGSVLPDGEALPMIPALPVVLAWSRFRLARGYDHHPARPPMAGLPSPVAWALVDGKERARP